MEFIKLFLYLSELKVQSLKENSGVRIMEGYELTHMQNLSLEHKIRKTVARIEEWYEYYNGEIFLSFSGGFNSTILGDIIIKMELDIPFVYSNTGLEHKQINEFIKKYDNIIIVKPKKDFRYVLKEKGYPMISKQVARFIRDIQDYNNGANNYNTYNLRMTGENQCFQYCPSQILPKKYYYLIDAPFSISEQCCDVIKKEPLHTYSKINEKFPITGQMACESSMRERNYLKYGCNAYNIKSPISNPVGFWLQKDMFEYAKKYSVEYCKVYGDIICNCEGCKFSGEQRTGCVFCGFGLHLEKEPNRIQRLKKLNINQYNYCLNDLGFKKVYEFMNIPYE